MKRHHTTNGQQYEANPVWGLHALAGSPYIHIEIGCHVVVCDLRALCKFVQSTSTALVKDEGVHQTELQTQKKENDSEHEIAIAIDVHDYPNPKTKTELPGVDRPNQVRQSKDCGTIQFVLVKERFPATEDVATDEKSNANQVRKKRQRIKPAVFECNIGRSTEYQRAIESKLSNYASKPMSSDTVEADSTIISGRRVKVGNPAEAST